MNPYRCGMLNSIVNEAAAIRIETHLILKRHINQQPTSSHHPSPSASPVDMSDFDYSVLSKCVASHGCLRSSIELQIFPHIKGFDSDNYVDYYDDYYTPTVSSSGPGESSVLTLRIAVGSELDLRIEGGPVKKDQLSNLSMNYKVIQEEQEIQNIKNPIKPKILFIAKKVPTNRELKIVCLKQSNTIRSTLIIQIQNSPIYSVYSKTQLTTAAAATTESNQFNEYEQLIHNKRYFYR